MGYAEHRLTVHLATGQTVPALMTETPAPFACLMLVHGAGAGMRHPFMAAAAHWLAERGVTTLRHQFLDIEAGSKWVDNPPVARCGRAGCTLSLFAGCKCIARV